MPKISSIKRRNLIKNLLKLGFDGPVSGGNHQYMTKGSLKLRIPNPHQGEISSGLLVRILKQAGVKRKIWEDL